MCFTGNYAQKWLKSCIIFNFLLLLSLYALEYLKKVGCYKFFMKLLMYSQEFSDTKSE